MNESSEYLPDEVMRGYLVEKMLQLREKWSNEVPVNDVTGKGDYKVRTQWWASVIGFMDYAKDYGFLSPEMTSKIEALSNKYSHIDAEFKHRFTNAQEIAEIDRLIGEVMEDLQRPL